MCVCVWQRVCLREGACVSAFMWACVCVWVGERVGGSVCVCVRV